MIPLPEPEVLYGTVGVTGVPVAVVEKLARALAPGVRSCATYVPDGWKMPCRSAWSLSPSSRVVESETPGPVSWKCTEPLHAIMSLIPLRSIAPKSAGEATSTW